MAEGDALFLAASLDLRSLAAGLDLPALARLAAAADVAGWHPPAQRRAPARAPTHPLPTNRRLRPRTRLLLDARASPVADVEMPPKSVDPEPVSDRPPLMPPRPCTPPRPLARRVHVLGLRPSDGRADDKAGCWFDVQDALNTPSPRKSRARESMGSPSDIRATALRF